MKNYPHRESQLEELDSAFQSFCDTPAYMGSRKDLLCVSDDPKQMRPDQIPILQHERSDISREIEMLLLSENSKLLTEKVRQSAIIQKDMRREILGLREKVSSLEKDLAKGRPLISVPSSIIEITNRLATSELENYRLKKELKEFRLIVDSVETGEEPANILNQPLYVFGAVALIIKLLILAMVLSI